jgi:hypothetical protein
MSWREHLQRLHESAPDEILAFLQAQSRENPADLELQFERAAYAQKAGNIYDGIGALIPVSRNPGHL